MSIQHIHRPRDPYEAMRVRRSGVGLYDPDSQYEYRPSDPDDAVLDPDSFEGEDAAADDPDPDYRNGIVWVDPFE